MTCLLNNVVFRTLPRESARSALRWLPPASLARGCLALAIFTVATAAGSHAQTASPRKGSHAQTASPRKGSHAQTASPRKGGHAQTASPPKERAAAMSAASRPGGEPIMAIVSLRSQGIIVYDSAHWIMRAPVSSGQSGRETPAGVFSVLQKDADHHSNLYDDAWMPHMHRLTWSGIALHGGPLPGYAASHGSVRLPYDFASRLFEMTKVGMRVIILSLIHI